MLHNSKLIIVILAGSFLLAGHALAQKTTIETQVKGLDGNPASAANIQIERHDRKAAPSVGRTDARGRFINSSLDPGTYKVTILVAGAPAQTQVVTTIPKKPVLIAIDMKQSAGAGPVKKKVYRWVESSTGTHMGGHYEEQGTTATTRGPATGVENVSARSLQQPMTQGSVPGGGR